MKAVNESFDIYVEGLAETLDECQGEWGLCCKIDDEFVHELGRNLYRTVTVYARGVGRRIMRLVDVQGDVLRGLDMDSGHILLIPACAVYLFHDAQVLPLGEDTQAVLRLDGGGSCRGCNGMVPELYRLHGQTIGIRLPQGDMRMKITGIAGLTLHGVSGDALVTLRVDCVDALELPEDASLSEQ